ncbi:Protein of uncharacterised function Smg [Salmonella enterica subsp. enterica]|uniref:Protein of uncharacterized function Smg n=1 Tax=Salmonella enterica I TaxID=59201 RepID=A0A447TUA6_SALET|nr:Protein of uncharacterised function Smg [Salmonella enterica subsp. enterica]
MLNLETREMVIERVLALDTAEFDLEDLKWVYFDGVIQHSGL